MIVVLLPTLLIVVLAAGLDIRWRSADRGRCAGGWGGLAGPSREDRPAAGFGRKFPQSLIIGQIFLYRGIIEIDATEPGSLGRIPAETINQSQSLPLAR